MTYTVSNKPALDGTGTAIPGGVVFVDESGTGVGPYLIGKATIDPNGVNAQLVLANGAAKSDLSSLNGINLGSPSAYGTAPGAVNVPGVNAFITNTVGVSGTITANAGSGNFNVAGTVAATQSGVWTVAQGTPPWSVSQSGAWTVTANAGSGTYTVGGTVAATQSGAWTVLQGSPPWTLQGTSASGAANAGNPVKTGGAFNTTQPTVTNGQTVDAQYTARGAAIVATGVDPFTVAQGSPPWSVSGTVTANAVQSGTWTVQQGTPPWTVAQSGTWNVGQAGNWTTRVVGNTGGVMDAAGQNASSPPNELLVAGQYNSAPTTITSGNVSPLQLDASGNLKVAGSFSAGSPADKTATGTVTAVNQTVSVNTQGDGNVTAIVTADTNVTLIFEATVDGTNWVTVNAYPVGGGTSTTSTAANGTWSVPIAGLSAFRLRVTAVGATPTATISLNAGAGSTNPNVVVSPTGANFNVNLASSAATVTVAGTVTANQGAPPWSVSSNTTQVNGVALGSPSAYGTSPGAVNVQGVNAFVTNTVPVSGTVTANAGTGTFTVGGTVAATQSGTWTVQQGTPPWSVSQSGAWTVTANAGTGTFTVGGTVAATQSGTWNVGQSGAPWTIQGDSASGAANAGNPLKIGGVFNTTQPTVTNGQTVDAQFTARGAQIVATGVDPFTVAQGSPPWSVSGTVTANQGGTWTVAQGSPPWSVSQSGAWNVGQTGNWTTRIVGNAGGAMDAAGQNAASPANQLIVGGQYNSAPTTITSGNVSPLQLDSSGNLKVAGSFSAGSPADKTATGTVTTVGQTVAVNTQGDGNVTAIVTADTNVTLAFEATVDGTNWVAVNAYPIGGGASVTSTAANGSWSIPIAGLSQFRLRVTAAGATPTATVSLNAGAGSTNPNVVVSPTGSNFNVNLASSAATVTVSGTVAATQSGAWNVGQTGTWTVQQGTPPWSVSQSGAWTVVANAGTGNFNSNLAQVNGSAVSTAGTGIQKVGITGNAGASLDATGQNATAPGNEIIVGGQFNTSPTTITSGNVSPLQLDSGGNLKVTLNGSTVTQPVSGTVTANAGTGTMTVAGTVTANQGGAPWSQNITQVNGSAVTTSATGQMKVGIVGNAGAAFDGANGTTAPANVLNIGGPAITTLPTAVTAGQITDISVDKFGRMVTLPQTTRDNIGTQTTTISTTTETTIATAGGAGVFNDIMMLIVSNTAASGSDTRIDFRDTTAGTILFSLMSRGGQQPIGFAMGGPAIPQTTANTNWTAQLAAALTDVRIYAVFAKNK